MNILVFSWRDPRHPLAGGAEQVMHEHMKGWLTAGHKVTLFSAHFKGAPRREALGGVDIIRKGYQLLGVHIAGFFWYLFGKHEKFDLVVDQFHGIPFFTPVYVRSKKLAVLQEVAREVWLMNHLPKPFNLIIGYLGYYLEPLIFRFYKKVPFMVGSESAKKDLEEFGIPGENITVVSHGVIIEKPKNVFSKENLPTVIFLGSLARDKGIEEALRVFSILNKKDNFSAKGGSALGWQFWVVGKAGKIYQNYLDSLVLRLDIKDKVKFWGFVSNEKKFELLSRAHVMVNPSFREGWGLVNIEANAMGTPVVAYRSAGLVDSVKDGFSGILCKYNNPKSLAENIKQLLDDEKKYYQLCRGAISWSKKFSWKKSKKRSLTLIDHLVSL